MVGMYCIACPNNYTPLCYNNPFLSIGLIVAGMLYELEGQ